MRGMWVGRGLLVRVRDGPTLALETPGPTGIPTATSLHAREPPHVG